MDELEVDRGSVQPGELQPPGPRSRHGGSAGPGDTSGTHPATPVASIERARLSTFVLPPQQSPDAPPMMALVRAALQERHGDDRRVYCAVASAWEAPLLELGAGTGRVLSALLEAGLDAWGLELDRDALEVGREQLARRFGLDAARRLLLGDMRDFELPRRDWGGILVPSNTLNLLLDDAALAACLHQVCTHLAPSGELLFDVSLAQGCAWFRPPYRWSRPPEVLRVRGEPVLCTEEGRYSPTSKLCEVHSRVLLKSGECFAVTTVTRARSPLEWLGALDAAGLRPTAEPLDERGAALSERSTRAFFRCCPR